MTKKRKSKRRPQHRPSYYERELPKADSIGAVVDLLNEAARQPKRIISDKEYERIFWQAQALLDAKGE